ncbi:MAG: hypothetical protein KDM91_21495, partial [Verrucomicrobiae bacterium]|nr:hypothetical protein [Verrucomicrobiae bacterium]
MLAAQEASPRLSPLAPADLLKVLPKCPEEWLLKRSEARTLHEGHLESYAIRVFEEFVGPDRRDEAPPETVVMTIRD